MSLKEKGKYVGVERGGEDVFKHPLGNENQA